MIALGKALCEWRTGCGRCVHQNPGDAPLQACIRTLEPIVLARHAVVDAPRRRERFRRGDHDGESERSEEHTSELQSLMRISYAVFCLKKKKTTISKVD